MPTYVGCCCIDAYNCDAITYPATVSITIAGLTDVCFFPDGPPCLSAEAPFENKTYTLTRYFTNDPDDLSPPPCASVGDCLACYRLGSLSVSDICAIYGATMDATCDGLFDIQCSETQQGGYEFLGTIECEDTSLIDVYIEFVACVTLTDSSGTATITSRFIYVSDPTGTPVVQLSGATQGTYLYPNQASGCVIGVGLGPCCSLFVSNPNCAGGFSAGVDIVTLSGPPDYSFSDTLACCDVGATLTFSAG